MSKKILITSIPAWSQKTGYNSWSSIFGFANPEDVANIFIENDQPDSEVASKYLRIKEADVVKGILNKKIITASPVETLPDINIESKIPAGNTDTNILEKLREFFRKKHFIVTLWIREILWFLGKWKSKELDDFINNFNPEVLVFSIESYFYFNRLNEYIIDKFKPRQVIAYMWDDNFTYKQYPNNYIRKIERYFLRKQVKRLINKSHKVLAILPQMKRELDSEYGIKSILITKPLSGKPELTVKPVSYPIKLLYTGRLGIGRTETLQALARAIKKINEKESRMRLDIYTVSSVPREVLDSLEIAGSSYVHPAVTQNEVFKLQRESDILVFPETMSCKNRVARLSFSTKLTDYFSAGRCILAIGSKELGPIRYIEEEDAGLVADSEEGIKHILQKIIDNPGILDEYGMKGYLCGAKNHNKENIFRIIRDDVIGY